MRRTAFLTWLDQIAGRLALPLALVLLCTGLPASLLAVPAHSLAVSAATDQGGDASLLEKRQPPAALAKPKLGGPQFNRADPFDGKLAIQATAPALPMAIRRTARAWMPEQTIAALPWRGRHRLPAPTGPPLPSPA